MGGAGDEGYRVDRLAVDAHFIMQMAARRAAGRAHEADQLAAMDIAVGGDQQLRHMAVARFHAAAMRNLDQVAIAAGPSGAADDAVGGDRKSTRLNSSH